LRASRPAAIITEGLEVLVHEVIEAMATCPWSSSVTVPSARVPDAGLEGWGGGGLGGRDPADLLGLPLAQAHESRL